jgi:hypothetical protein
MVDKEAELAGKRNLRTSTPWHVDAAREEVSGAWAPSMVDTIWKQRRPALHRGMWPDTETRLSSTRTLPPLIPNVKHSATTLQLRTGIWPSLGPSRRTSGSSWPLFPAGSAHRRCTRSTAIPSPACPDALRPHPDVTATGSPLRPLECQRRRAARLHPVRTPVFYRGTP